MYDDMKREQESKKHIEKMKDYILEEYLFDLKNNGDKFAKELLGEWLGANKWTESEVEEKYRELY